MRYFILAMLLAFPAYAHDATPTKETPLGWTYDPKCCGGLDCHEDDEGLISEEGGGFRIKNTGELIPYGSSKVHESKDFHRHICQVDYGNGDGLQTTCIYLPMSF